MQVRIVDRVVPPSDGKVLVPLAMRKLPLGSIRPEGWLKRQLEIALEGLPGRLWKTGKFLGEGNGWLHPEKIFIGSWASGDRPWEEQAYYLRTLVPLAVQTGDPVTLGVAEKYMRKMLESREPDGWFGPQSLKHSRSDDPEEKIPMLDLWPHMVVCEAVLDWYEYTREPRYLAMLRDFMHFCLRVPENEFMSLPKPGKGFSWLTSIQFPRACDMLPSLYRVMELAGDDELLPLAHKFYRHWGGPATEFMSSHTVNFAQLFTYRSLYSRASNLAWHRKSADYWYEEHMSVWGTLPRGAFCADENIRRGCTDPRYGMESCTFSELCRSFSYLGELNMECRWADRTEDLLFNHYPAAHTRDMKKVHYVTSPNQVMLDDFLSHNVANASHMFAYTDTRDRCCLHNAGLAWPRMAEYMMTAVCDGGVCAWLHGPCSAELKAGREGKTVRWVSETQYPFRDRVTFTFHGESPAAFPFYMRIPRWCGRSVLKINGEEAHWDGEAAGKFLAAEREWTDGDRVELYLPSKITLSENIRSGGVTVDKGPFSYSLLIPERENLVVSSSEKEKLAWKKPWNEENGRAGDVWTELLPAGPWNYGLLPEEGFSCEELPVSGKYVFDWRTPPLRIRAKGRKIPGWKLQDHMCAPLQESPVRSGEPTEEIFLIPLGCARLRLSVFPVISDEETARVWKDVPEETDMDSRPALRI